MPKYLIEASYNSEGVKGVLAKGGTARREAIDKLLTNVGGKLESFYFAFGSTDVYVVADVPDNVTAAAIGLTVSSSGAVSCRTIVLLTPEEIDRAASVQVDYARPGG